LILLYVLAFKTTRGKKRGKEKEPSGRASWNKNKALKYFGETLAAVVDLNFYSESVFGR
jgi:hypothetical protein